MFNCFGRRSIIKSEVEDQKKKKSRIDREVIAPISLITRLEERNQFLKPNLNRSILRFDLGSGSGSSGSSLGYSQFNRRC
jgi:hypothetical protein